MDRASDHAVPVDIHGVDGRVIGRQVGYAPTLDADSEVLAALWQVCELVPLLAAENQQAWEVIDGLKEMAVQQAATQQLNLNRAQRRALKRTNGGILLPR